MKRQTEVPFLLIAFTFIGLSLAASPAWAQEQEPPLRNELKYGIGVQYAAPAFGVSGMYDLTNEISGQVVLGLLGGLQMYSGRVLYRFKQEEAYNIYGFGTVGVWSYSALGSSASILGVGGGAGLEYSWAQLFDSAEIPPLFGNIEIGFIRLTGDFSNYSFSALTYGAGIHYRF